MSLIIKSESITGSNNLISLPINCDSSNIELTEFDFITSYIQLEESDTINKFLNTDALTDDATDDSSNKILSSLGFASYRAIISKLISDSQNTNCA